MTEGHFLLEQFITDRQANNRSPATIRNYRLALSPFVEFVGDRPLTPVLVREYKIHISSNGWKDTTIRSNCRCVRAFLNFCYTQGYIDKAIPVTMPKVDEPERKVLTNEEITKILSKCRKQRDRALVCFALDSGLRLSELVRLEWRDVDIKNGRVLVRKAKGRRPRVIYVGEQSRALLTELKEGSTSKTVFGLKQSGIKCAFERLAKRSGVKFSAHTLRRTCITRMITNGADLIRLKRFSGHSEIKTLELYAVLVEDDIAHLQDEFGVLDHLNRR